MRLVNVTDKQTCTGVEGGLVAMVDELTCTGVDGWGLVAVMAKVGRNFLRSAPPKPICLFDLKNRLALLVVVSRCRKPVLFYFQVHGSQFAVKNNTAFRNHSLPQDWK